MKRIYEFKCRNCGQVFDRLIESQHRIAVCTCSGFADRIISRSYFKESIDSDRWVKNRESHMKQEQKNLRNHGTYR